MKSPNLILTNLDNSQVFPYAIIWRISVLTWKCPKGLTTCDLFLLPHATKRKHPLSTNSKQNINLLRKEEDKEVAFAAQYTMIPRASNSNAPEKFNLCSFNSTPSQKPRALLVIVASSRGTSAQVVLGKKRERAFPFSRNGTKRNPNVTQRESAFIRFFPLAHKRRERETLLQFTWKEGRFHGASRTKRYTAAIKDRQRGINNPSAFETSRVEEGRVSVGVFFMGLGIGRNWRGRY